jgi:RNA polymerase sigma-70 factor (ECF subfamily)
MNTPTTSTSYPQVQAQRAAEPPRHEPPPPIGVPDGPTDGVGGDRLREARRVLRAQREEEAHVDLELVRRAQGGDEAAFRSLVERHQRRAFAIALATVRHEQDARDVVQDAFLRVHKSLGTFQGGSSFFTWLYRIVTNLAIDLVRRPGRNADALADDRGPSSGNEGPEPMWVAKVDGADPVDVMRRKELAERMRTAIDALPSYHKAVILMREVEGLSYEEMAEAMQVSKGTIMSRLFHARQKLQKALADCYEEENDR